MRIRRAAARRLAQHERIDVGPHPAAGRDPRGPTAVPSRPAAVRGHRLPDDGSTPDPCYAPHFPDDERVVDRPMQVAHPAEPPPLDSSLRAPRSSSPVAGSPSWTRPLTSSANTSPPSVETSPTSPTSTVSAPRSRPVNGAPPVPELAERPGRARLVRVSPGSPTSLGGDELVAVLRVAGQQSVTTGRFAVNPP